MGFRPEVVQILRLNKLRSEGRINLAEFIASANRLIEGAVLDGEISMARRILKEGEENEDRDSRVLAGRLAGNEGHQVIRAAMGG